MQVGRSRGKILCARTTCQASLFSCLVSIKDKTAPSARIEKQTRQSSCCYVHLSILSCHLNLDNGPLWFAVPKSPEMPEKLCTPIKIGCKQHLRQVWAVRDDKLKIPNATQTDRPALLHILSVASPCKIPFEALLLAKIMQCVKSQIKTKFVCFFVAC